MTRTTDNRDLATERAITEAQARFLGTIEAPCPECGGPADTGAGHDCEAPVTYRRNPPSDPAALAALRKRAYGG